MKDYELVKWLKYSDSKRILIVDKYRQLKELLCPFKVFVVESVEGLKKGSIVLVIDTKVTRELILVYIINGKAYYYYHFEFIT